jgi:hypothetical protein
LNDLLNGRRYGEDQTKRKIATALGYPDRHYEDFLDIGRIILNGKSVEDNEKYGDLSDDALRVRGFLPLNFSESMILGPDDQIKVTDDFRKTHVIVHGPSIRRSTSVGLQAFRTPDDGMEPLIPKNSVIVVDLTQNAPELVKEGQIYVVCPDKETGQCYVRSVFWGEKNRLILICPENRKHRILVKEVNQVKLVGRVIMANRTL